MPIELEVFEKQIARLKADIVEQGRRVERMVEASIESLYDHDQAKADWVIEHDAIIDCADVEIERAAVDLLCDIARTAVDLPAKQLRLVLMIVKVNNELERCADLASDIAEQVGNFSTLPTEPSRRFRVMANSVVGIVRDTATCLERVDTKIAQSVLASDDTMDRFEQAILHEMQQGVAAGSVPVEFAFAANIVANHLERIGDHCTNIAEQIIYIATGQIVRHMKGQWSEPQDPQA